MLETELEEFILGGGTSLSLRFGHRQSIDLNLFTIQPFNSRQFINLLHSLFNNLEVVNQTVGSVCTIAHNFKLDILHHPYPLLFNPIVDDGIRFFSLPDLAAMKINAVTNRGSKKDFTDLLLLHENGINLAQALDYFCDKYGNAGRFLAVRSLAWFEDAESEPDPIFLNGWVWKDIRQRIESLVDGIIR
ncbi:MAG: nucleotidyl transferase AbiEii/AbiGii toxin family protein [Spirochaetaceae bacterium]|nr:nucleotidyl transferase AbiEii/AbiGii toxin family protein [Spirochaetaceae bacterium]